MRPLKTARFVRCGRRRAMGSALLVLGLLGIAQGLYIPAKAALAQVLLERAFADPRNLYQAARPWPWADTYPVARLTIPRLGHEVIALDGASGRTLAFGPGHVPGTADPGQVGNSVLAGHRDTHFAFLEDLAVGDEILVEDRQHRRHVYEVTGTRVVHERDASVLSRAATGRLTLVTCWPFHAVHPGASERYVVEAKRQDCTSPACRPGSAHSML